MMLDGPEAEAFILARLKATTMHEVGHTLGLTHNFRASTVYTEAQLADPEFTRENGIAGSVMEYNAVNLALTGEKQGEYHMSTLGPYDYWAIEYGYRELAPEQEAAELAAHRGALHRARARVHGRRHALSTADSTRWRTRSTWAPIRWPTPTAS